jgi:hypothetical protein
VTSDFWPIGGGNGATTNLRTICVLQGRIKLNESIRVRVYQACDTGIEVTTSLYAKRTSHQTPSRTRDNIVAVLVMTKEEVDGVAMNRVGIKGAERGGGNSIPFAANRNTTKVYQFEGRLIRDKEQIIYVEGDCLVKNMQWSDARLATLLAICCKGSNVVLTACYGECEQARYRATPGRVTQ